MKKSWIVIIVVALVAIVFYGWIKNTYNTLVTKSQAVNQEWSEVENYYQRRADLIPNLVNTVKGYAKHEKQTLVDVVQARAKATAVNIDANHLTPEALQKFQNAQSGLTQALSRLMVVVERYPNLKANQNFLELQAQLEGTENRIATARRRFNLAVQNYNTYLLQFPRNILSGMFNFKKKTYFKAEAGAQKAPTVKF